MVDDISVNASVAGGTKPPSCLVCGVRYRGHCFHYRRFSRVVCLCVAVHITGVYRNIYGMHSFSAYSLSRKSHKVLSVRACF